MMLVKCAVGEMGCVGGIHSVCVLDCVGEMDNTGEIDCVK